MTNDEALAARRRLEARRFAMASKRVERIADTGMVGNQPVSSEVVRSAVEELEAEIDRLNHRLSNQAATIRVQSETIRRLEEAEKSKRLDEVLEALKVTAIEQIHGETARIGQAVNFLCSIVDVYKRRLEQAESMPKQDSTSPNEPPLPQRVANVQVAEKWAGSWTNFKGWRVPDTTASYVMWKGEGEPMYWRLSIESGWVEAEKWGEPVAVHPAPNVTIAGGE